MEKEVDKQNRKFILIGIGIFLLIGTFWTINNVDFNEVGDKIKGVWEKYIREDKKEVIQSHNVSGTLIKSEVFTPTIIGILIFSFIMIVIGILAPICFPKKEDEEDYEEEDEYE